jgi:hypothetical protein
MNSRMAAIRRFVASPTPVVVDKLRGRFWTAVEQRFSGPPVKGITTSPVWNEISPEVVSVAERDRCLGEADKVLSGGLTVFGTQVDAPGAVPDWKRDPMSGLSWPLRHHSRIDVLDLDRPSDARVVWEINRCQHLIPLAQAFVLTRDDQYAEACLKQIDDWIRHNPPEMGINWTSSMEVAIRGIVWTWLLQALCGSSALTEDRRQSIARSLLAHGRHISRHPEHEEHSGNHYLANALGLIVLGHAFREAGEGRRWLELGQKIMEAEIPRQFYADGVNYEGSTAYHGLALEMALLGQVALQQNNLSLNAQSVERLLRALDVSLALTRADGTYPAIGDVDDGHILPLGVRPPRTQLHLLAQGAALFSRPDLAAAGLASAPEICWLLGATAVGRLNALARESPEPTSSRLFPQGGLVIQQTASHHLVVDCGDVGSLGRGGHGHCDLLSFECFAQGSALVVDGGTFTYSGDPEARNRFRGVSQHNTLALDDRETLEPADLWSFKQTASPRLLRWSTGPDCDTFGGRYDLPGQGAQHERWIYFDRLRGAWLIDDRIIGQDVHHPVLRFHVPSREIHLGGDQARVTYAGSAKLLIQLISSEWAHIRIDRSSISPMYRQKQPSSVIVFEGSAMLPSRCLTALVPYEGQCPDRDSVREWARFRESQPEASSLYAEPDEA